MPTALESLFAADGKKLAVAGNEPIVLDSAQRVFLVLAGQVELFAVRQPSSSRVHITTIEPGGMLFGFEAAPAAPFGRKAVERTSDSQLLAVALPGTELLEIDKATLTRLAREEESLELLAAPIETWLSSLFSGIPRRNAPQHFAPLQAGDEVELDEEGKSARIEGGVVWVRHVQGSSLFLGRSELPLMATDFLMPITEETWLTSREPATLSCVETRNLFRSGTIWDGLSQCHDFFLRHLALEAEAGEDAERKRIHRQVEFDRSTLNQAYSHLASILGPDETRRAELATASNAMLEVCQMVGEGQGIEIRWPTEKIEVGKTAKSLEQQLNAICTTSRVRNRRVILRDDWWAQDNGSLVAFRLEEQDGADIRRPVAILPTSPRSYELVDPELGTREAFDESMLDELAGEAFMFYPPLPERKVGGGDLLKLALAHRQRDIITIVAMGAVGGLLSLMVPILTGQIFGNVIPDADRSQLLQMTMALMTAALAAAAFQITRSIAVLRITGKMDGTLQTAVWDRLLSLPLAFFRNYSVGDLASRSVGIDAIRSLLLGNMTTSLLSAIFSVFSFALLFHYSWQLALVACGMVGLLVLLSSLLTYLQLRHQREIQRLQGKIASLLFGLIHGISKLRAAGAEARAYALWAEKFSQQRRRTFQAQQFANAQATLGAVYTTLAALVIFATMGKTAELNLSLSEFLAFYAALGQFQAAALSLVSLFSTTLIIIPIWERILPILEAVPEVDASKTAVGELSGDIEFSHVSFRYLDDGPLILDDITLRARPGEFVALAGSSGAGKSTCLRLLLGFEDPLSGSIYYDGQDLPSLNLQSLRRRIGVVLQNGRPMSGDIYSNIVGNSNLGIDAAWDAARMAGLEEDIRAMPMGMHTVISEGAGTFSGGQQQRLLIARAMVNRPRVLLFDEATSALDNRTQEIVSQSLERLKATRIVVAHRLSTIENADRIYFFDSGKIVESGTYDELIRQGGMFAKLAERQIA